MGFIDLTKFNKIVIQGKGPRVGILDINPEMLLICSLMLENLTMNMYYQVKIVNVILALQVKRWFVHWTYANLNKLKDKPVICT